MPTSPPCLSNTHVSYARVHTREFVFMVVSLLRSWHQGCKCKYISTLLCEEQRHLQSGFLAKVIFGLLKSWVFQLVSLPCIHHMGAYIYDII